MADPAAPDRHGAPGEPGAHDEAGLAHPAVRDAAVVVPCDPLQPTLEFFTRRLGFRVDAIFPADSPATAELSGHGLALRLRPPEPPSGATAPAGPPSGPATGLVLRLRCDDPALLGGAPVELVAPNGARVELVPAEPGLSLPPVQQSFVVTHAREQSSWGVGRAGMHYRDLIPGRQGGRFIGSHIRITADGPVADWVHYHEVRFQMIYCHRGWVRLVYEDQGDPFVLEAGDCVLQPPRIRHRVLESGGGLEVVELGCPAEHETLADHVMTLPTGAHLPARDFGGQRFVRHVASGAAWGPWRVEGFEARDLGIGRATEGLAGVRVARPTTADRTPVVRHGAEFVFGFVLSGRCVLECDGHGPEVMQEGDTFVVPAGAAHSLTGCTADFQLLDVTLPELVPIA